MNLWRWRMSSLRLTGRSKGLGMLLCRGLIQLAVDWCIPQIFEWWIMMRGNRMVRMRIWFLWARNTFLYKAFTFETFRSLYQNSPLWWTWFTCLRVYESWLFSLFLQILPFLSLFLLIQLLILLLLLVFLPLPGLSNPVISYYLTFILYLIVMLPILQIWVILLTPKFLPIIPSQILILFLLPLMLVPVVFQGLILMTIGPQRKHESPKFPYHLYLLITILDNYWSCLLDLDYNHLYALFDTHLVYLT